MDGTIQFENAESLAQFLKGFVGCTATFSVMEMANGRFTLTFNGGF